MHIHLQEITLACTKLYLALLWTLPGGNPSCYRVLPPLDYPRNNELSLLSSSVLVMWRKTGTSWNTELFKRLKRLNYEGRLRKHEQTNKPEHGQQGQKMIVKKHNNSSVWVPYVQMEED